MLKKLSLALLASLILGLSADCSFCAAVNPVQDMITKVIKSYLIEKDPRLDGKRIEVTFKYADKTFRELKYRSGIVSFEVAELYPDFKPLGNIIIPIQVVVNGEEKEKIFLRSKVSVYDKIVVAVKRLKRGDMLTNENVALADRDIASLSSAVIRDESLALGKEAKTTIPLDNAIYDWMIKERPLVKKNGNITIIAGSENMTITAKGISSEDGSLGQSVKIRNLDSGKELTAIVTGTDEVTMQ